MQKVTKLISTEIELFREINENNQTFYKLVIGTDPQTRLVMTHTDLENLLGDLPNLLSTVIHSQVLIENLSPQEESQS